MDQLKQHALEIIERNVIALVESERKIVGNGVIPVISNPAAPWTKIPDQNLNAVNYVANGTEIPIVINPGQGIRLALINYANPGFAYVSSNARLEFFDATTNVKVGEAPIVSLRSSNAPLSPFPFDGASVDGQPLVIPNVWNVPVKPRLFGGNTAFPGIWFDDSMAYQLVILSGGDFEEERRLHNELVDGVKIPTARLTTLLGQANLEASAHQSFVQRREEYKGATPAITFEVRKKLVESYLATSRNEVELATALKGEAFAIIERDIVSGVETARRDATGEIGRLHNEIVNGLGVPTSRMTTLLNQAVADAIAHQKALHKADDDDIPLPPVSYEIKKLLVESYLLSIAGEFEVSAAAKSTALQLIERDVVANDEETRKNTRAALALTEPQSFGYHWGRVGLAFEGSLSYSDNAIKRAVTSAEEALMNTGKWVGTVAEYTLTISASGAYSLPREVETVLFVAFDGNPAPVHDRYMEYMRGGTGIKTTDNAWRTGFSDLGHVPDPADGNKLKRKYFITVPQEGKETVILYLAKRRFVPHTTDTELMYLRNYEAVAQAAMAVLTQGQVGSLEIAKKLLAEQITQQFMKTQTWGVHNRPILNLR